MANLHRNTHCIIYRQTKWWTKSFFYSLGGAEVTIVIVFSWWNDVTIIDQWNDVMSIALVICVNCVVGVTCFQAFFSYPEMQPLLKHFCVYHVSAPGQRDNAPLISFGWCIVHLFFNVHFIRVNGLDIKKPSVVQYLTSTNTWNFYCTLIICWFHSVVEVGGAAILKVCSWLLQKIFGVLNLPTS